MSFGRAEHVSWKSVPTLTRAVKSCRSATSIYWAPSTLIMVIGCATVDPSPDYQRADRLIAERTGVEGVYDPEADELIAEKVDRLLSDGLTVEEAVQVALLNNRSFQALFHEIGLSRAEVVRSGLMTNPSLGLSLRFPEGGGRSNLTLTLAQELIDLWQIPVRKRIAEAQLEQTVLSVARRAVDLAADVTVKYYQLLGFLLAQEIAQQNLELVERSLKLAQDRYTAGQAGKLDVNLTQANLLDVKLEMMSLGRECRIADVELARALGLVRGEQSWKLKGSLPEGPVSVADHTTLLVFAMGRRMDARAMAMQVQAAEDEIRQQYLNIVPSVTLGAELERTENRALPGRKIPADTVRESVRNGQPTVPSIQSRDERNAEKRQIIDSLLGPTLDITLPVWHQNQPEIAKARFKASQKRKEYEDLLDAVAQDVEQAFTRVKVAEEVVTFFEKQALPQARENVDVAQRVYQAGKESIIALIDAQKSLIRQRGECINIRRDYAIALAELKRAVGGGLPSEQPNESPSTQPKPQ